MRERNDVENVKIEKKIEIGNKKLHHLSLSLSFFSYRHFAIAVSF